MHVAHKVKANIFTGWHSVLRPRPCKLLQMLALHAPANDT